MPRWPLLLSLLALLVPVAGCATPSGWEVPGLRFQVAFAPDGQRVVCAPDSTHPEHDEQIRIVDPSRPEAGPVVLPLPMASVYGLAFASPEELRVLVRTGGVALGLYRFDPRDGRPLGPLVPLPVPAGGMVLRAAASLDGARWVLAWDHALSCVEVGPESASLKWERAFERADYLGHVTLTRDGALGAVAVSPITEEGGHVVVHAPRIELFEAATGTRRAELGPLLAVDGTRPVLDLETLAFSPDGATLASGEDQGRVRLWSVADATHRASVLLVPEAHPTSLAWSPDGRWLAVGSDDKAVAVFGAPAGGQGGPQALWRDDPPGGAQGFRTAVAFSPDGRLVARACAFKAALEPDQRQLRVYEAATGEEPD